MSRFILSIDQGTTGTRAFIVDAKGKVRGSAYQEFKQYYPKPGWVEHDANEIWATTKTVVRNAIKASALSGKNIAAIGITNQRETTVLWDRKTSKPVHKAIVWQCRRTADDCTKLKAKGLGETFKRKTGLVLDAYFSGTKIKWLLDHVKGLRHKAKAGRIAFGTMDAWLIWNLTGGASHTTDMTNASRTLLFNIRTKKWDEDLLKILKIPSQILPKVQNSGSIFGETKAGMIPGLPGGIPIAGVMGDQQAALYGQGCYQPGQMKNTYGTGAFLVCNTGKKHVASKHGLLTTLACNAKGEPVYALEGSIFIAGAVVQWLRDEVGLLKSAADSEKMIQGISDTAGVYIVPAFVGLGAPYWQGDARGLITGLTRGANNKHLIRAALESMAYQTKDVFSVMEKDYGKKIKELRVDGGACQNNFLMQFQSDLLGARVLRPKVIESTVAGVTHLAGLMVGVWTQRELANMHQSGKVFSPKMTSAKRKQLYAGWQAAVKRAM